MRSSRDARFTVEFVVTAFILLLACLSLVFIGSLVAPPKVLFGRSLTAITPSLLPTIVLSVLAILCALLLAVRWRENPPVRESGHSQGWQRGSALFVLMIFYALTMQPFGFLISTALTLASIAFLVGNRSVLQISVLSIIAPVLLYLAATRLLAVSLPELSAIEFAYSRALGR